MDIGNTVSKAIDGDNGPDQFIPIGNMGFGNVQISSPW